MNCELMRRREFITLLGASAAAWPLAANAQQQRRLGVLSNGLATDAHLQAGLATFTQGLRKLGWIDGQNLRIEVRWTGRDANLMRAYATDLVGLFNPDVLLVTSTSHLIAVQQATRTIPIVFTGVSDPVEQGFVPNLARPGGNVTGFANMEFSVAGKWVDLLRQMAPSVARMALIFNPEGSPQAKLYVSTAEVAARSLGVELLATSMRSAGEIELTFARLSREPNVGLIIPRVGFDRAGAKQIVESAGRYRFPTIYGTEGETSEGGLMIYTNDTFEGLRLAPIYIDRILKGTSPGDLPIQLPTRFKLIVNRKTASALGIEVPLGLLLAADEVID